MCEHRYILEAGLVIRGAHAQHVLQQHLGVIEHIHFDADLRQQPHAFGVGTVLLQESADALLRGSDLPFIQEEGTFRERCRQTRQPSGGARSFICFVIQAERSAQALQCGPTGGLRIVELNRAPEGLESPRTVSLRDQQLSQLLLRLSGIRAGGHLYIIPAKKSGPEGPLQELNRSLGGS